MREALERALSEKPDTLMANMVAGVVGQAAQAESAHDRYVAKVTANPQIWMETCNEWFRIGVDYNEGFISVENVRRRAKAQVGSITEWEVEGVTHLLYRLESGLRNVFTVEVAAEGFGRLIEFRATGIPFLDLPSETFVDEFKGLLDLKGLEAEQFDQFLLRERLASSSQTPYHRIHEVIPMIGKWVHLQYGSENR